MANEDDNYKEGVDFEYVQGNGDDNSNFKTRRFFTRAEKAARAAGTTMPKAAPVKAKPKAMAKPKLQGITTVPITVSPIPVPIRSGEKPSPLKHYQDMLKSGKLSSSEERTVRTTIDRLQSKTNKLKDEAAKQADISGVKRDVAETFAGKKWPASQYKKGGAVKMKEGSAKDTREDKVKAKKAGMTMAKWESSAADKKHDSGMKKGGSVKSSGIAKRGSGVEKKAMGGTVRGAGCAMRGKTGAKEY